MKMVEELLKRERLLERLCLKFGILKEGCMCLFMFLPKLEKQGMLKENPALDCLSIKSFLLEIKIIMLKNIRNMHGEAFGLSLPAGTGIMCIRWRLSRFFSL